MPRSSGAQEATIPRAVAIGTVDPEIPDLPFARADLSSSADAQQVAHLRCPGLLFGSRAVIDGLREYAPYNALGDEAGPLRGTVAAVGLIGEMHYAGYTGTAVSGRHVRSTRSDKDRCAIQ